MLIMKYMAAKRNRELARIDKENFAARYHQQHRAEASNEEGAQSEAGP